MTYPPGDVGTPRTVACGQRRSRRAPRPHRANRPDGSTCTDPTRRGGTPVVQAYILIQTDVGRAATVAASISEIEGVALAEDVTGPYDVIARVEASTVDELGKLVIAKIQDVEGITRTLTCTGFLSTFWSSMRRTVSASIGAV